jgi:tetraacyldisaccharide-1-P 4'-kinase
MLSLKLSLRRQRKKNRMRVEERMIEIGNMRVGGTGNVAFT